MITRRKFLSRSVYSSLIAGSLSSPMPSLVARAQSGLWNPQVMIVGGGLGGVSAALSALRRGSRVVISEETPWLGGQLTSQGVPPDEHRWIETRGANASYRALRQGIRQHYLKYYPVLPKHLDNTKFNPGKGSVSRLCHEPRAALAVIQALLAPYVSSGQCRVLTRHRVAAASMSGDRIQAIELVDLKSGQTLEVRANVFIDASELGELLPLTKTEWVTGSEAQHETGEWHASSSARPDNQQAFTVCLAMDHVEGEEHVINPPSSYDFWKSFRPALQPAWPGRLLDWNYTHPRSMEPRRLGFNPSNGPFEGIINLWQYRRMIAADQFTAGHYKGDISLINWPQNDYFLGSLIDGSPEQQQEHVRAAKDLSLSLLYWMQTEAPRHDGGQGYPGLRLRGDVMGSQDGLALYPYVRESRRIQAHYTVTEKDCGKAQRMEAFKEGKQSLLGEHYSDSVGVGSYPIDLHPTTGGDNYIDFEALPFELPLRALIPLRVENLLPACKNIGTTHVTNGCYRLHPVEWGIGEAAGALAAVLVSSREPVQAFAQPGKRVESLRASLHAQGVETSWKEPL